VILVALLVAAPLSGQTVSGRVRDASRQALPRVELSLIDSAGRALASARSNDSGDYRIRIPGAGRYRLTARRLGFVGGLSPWLVSESGDESLSFDFTLAAAPQSIAGVTTEAAKDPVSIRSRFGIDPKNINAFVVSPEQVEEYRATAHGIGDMIRRVGIPGGLTIREDDLGEPCIQLVGRDRHCMLIVVDDIITNHVRDLDLNTVQDIIVMRPNEAGLWFGSLARSDVAVAGKGGPNDPNQRSTAGGVLLIRTRLGTARKEK
jgi:hypothetical protein